MTRSPTYLWQNKHGYCFRIHIPQDLHTYWGKKELKRSLGTGYLSQARYKAMIMGARCKQLFKWTRYQTKMGKMTEQEIQDVVDLFVEYIGDVDICGERVILDARAFTPEELRDKINKAKDAVLHYKQAAETGDYTGGIRVDLEVDDLLNHTVDDPPAVGTPEFKVICSKAAEALRNKWEAYQKHHTERLAGVYDAVSDGAQPTQAEPAGPTMPLEQLITDFAKQKVEAGKWDPGTIRNHRPKINAMLQVFGEDRPVDQIAVQDVREFAKVLELLPPGFALKGYGDLTGVTSSELEGKHDQTLDITTRREYLNLTKSVFTFALDNEYVDKNPVIAGLIPPKKGNPRKQRSPFSKDDLDRIFNSETYLKWSKDRPSRFFIPLLALFTGSRLEEMANLHCEDVFQHEESGLWCIEHNLKNGRKLKNPNAIRTIPLHPILVDEFTFPQYVDLVRSGGHRRVFPELTMANNKYSHNLGKAFGYYLRKKVGISNKKKTFHSFRHNVTDHLFKQMVQESIIEELRGGAGKTEGSRRYFQGYRAVSLYEECIMKLDYGIDISHLKDSKFVPT